MQGGFVMNHFSNLQNKTEYLQNLKETELMRNVLIPLFEAMGFSNVRFTHGPRDLGLDVVLELENFLGEKEFIGVLVEIGAIHGSAVRSGSVINLIGQCEMLFGRGYDDPFDGARKKISKMLIITPSKITSSARDYIYHNLSQRHVGISFIDGQRLISLIDQYLPNFFASTEERPKAAMKCFKVGSQMCPKASTEKPRQVFIAVPFSGKFKDIYKHGVVSALREVNEECDLSEPLTPWRADEHITNIDLLCKICHAIQESRFAVINVTGWNPNVLFEMGLAYGLGKEVLLLKEKEQPVPTDLKGMEYIPYENSDEVKIALKSFFVDKVG